MQHVTKPIAITLANFSTLLQGVFVNHSILMAKTTIGQQPTAVFDNVKQLRNPSIRNNMVMVLPAWTDNRSEFRRYLKKRETKLSGFFSVFHRNKIKTFERFKKPKYNILCVPLSNDGSTFCPCIQN